eukprot:271544-Rhodomonas_salina.1
MSHRLHDLGQRQRRRIKSWKPSIDFDFPCNFFACITAQCHVMPVSLAPMRASVMLPNARRAASAARCKMPLCCGSAMPSSV